MYRRKTIGVHNRKVKESKHCGFVDENGLKARCACGFSTGLCRFLYEAREHLEKHFDMTVDWRQKYPDARISVP